MRLLHSEDKCCEYALHRVGIVRSVSGYNSAKALAVGHALMGKKVMSFSIAREKKNHGRILKI